jgi:hypothetical protein
MVCLRDNQRCAMRLAPRYRRYGFACVYGTLLTRWESLRRRPLTDLQIAPGKPCPVTTETGRVGPYPGLGLGPAYPIGTHNLITMRVPPPEGWGPEWSGTKRVWLLDTRYAARVLVRGRQLDGPNEMRFVLGRPGFTEAKVLNPIPELRVEGASSPSLTRLRAPGCYAYQVDGLRRGRAAVSRGPSGPTSATLHQSSSSPQRPCFFRTGSKWCLSIQRATSFPISAPASSAVRKWMPCQMRASIVSSTTSVKRV